jgi:hypothetical protein
MIKKELVGYIANHPFCHIVCKCGEIVIFNLGTDDYKTCKTCLRLWHVDRFDHTAVLANE